MTPGPARPYSAVRHAAVTAVGVLDREQIDPEIADAVVARHDDVFADPALVRQRRVRRCQHPRYALQKKPGCGFRSSR